MGKETNVMQPDEQFNAVYERTYDEVYRFILSRCGSVADAADILQDSYLAFYRRLCKGPALRRPGAYLRAVVRHELGRHYGWAARARRQIPVFTPDETEDFEGLEGAFLSEEIDDTHLIAAEVWAEIRRLDPLTYQIFLLYFVRGDTLAQIARELGCGESMVKSRLFRTLKKLRDRFE